MRILQSFSTDRANLQHMRAQLYAVGSRRSSEGFGVLEAGVLPRVQEQPRWQPIGLQGAAALPYTLLAQRWGRRRSTVYLLQFGYSR